MAGRASTGRSGRRECATGLSVLAYSSVRPSEALALAWRHVGANHPARRAVDRQRRHDQGHQDRQEPQRAAARAALGRLQGMAICAPGRRQRADLRPLGQDPAAEQAGVPISRPCALDCPVDLTRPMGEAPIATVAQLERATIGERTRDKLAERRAQGVKLGRPRKLPNEVRERIHTERDAGKSLRAIADALNGDQVPTARGGKMRGWRERVTRRSPSGSHAGASPPRGRGVVAVARCIAGF